MVTLSDLLSYLGGILGDAADIDPDMANGLQFRGKEEVRKVATGVSASLELFKRAVAAEADSLIVHHGILLPRSPYVDTLLASRLEYLFANRLSLLGYHYLLDSHPEVGHSAEIIRRLGARRTDPFRNGWGWRAEFEEVLPRSEVVERCIALFGPLRAEYLFGPERIKRLIVVTGGGAPQYAEVPAIKTDQVDLYITGEVHEWDREVVREAGFNLVAGGHYNTERFGLWALGDLIRRDLPVEVEFIDLPNEV
ncbi:MAG: Nif3-like dinuclear metal center hexameric protein [Dehalococcoidia bacterium]|nr:Nif3-like dinuclear metal center hexameric protein [Dehalococcoidia bacterium]